MDLMKQAFKEIRCMVSQLFEQVARGEINTICDVDFNEIRYSLNGIPGNADCKLYRYSKADVWNLCNLSQQQLRLSPVGNMNDVYEGVPYGSVAKTSAHDWDVAKEMAYLSCLSEEGCSPTMWAHYADEYKGMCIEYDLSRLEDEHPVLNHLYPVCYTDKRSINMDLHDLCGELELYRRDCMEANIFSGDLELLNNMTALFLSKGIEWAYENEWRVVVPAHRTLDCGMQESVFENLVIPFKCISAVCFGPRMPADVRRLIARIVRSINQEAEDYRKIELRQLEQTEGDFCFTQKIIDWKNLE